MPKRIIENDEYDLSLSRSAKLITAISAQIISWAIWLLFSTPATIEFCSQFSPDIQVLGFYSGRAMGIIAGLVFSVLEMLFTYFWLWKRNNYYWIGIVICMGVSIAATTGFTDIANQQAGLKVDSIANAERLVDNTEKAIEQEKRQYEAYDREETMFSESRGYVPAYVSARRRQSQERLTGLNTTLNNQIMALDKLKRETGAIVTLDPIKSIDNPDNEPKSKIFTFSNFLAVILEVFIVLLLIISNAVWHKIDSVEKKITNNVSRGFELANYDGNGRDTELRSEPASIILDKQSAKRPIGFAKHDDGNKTINLRVNSEEQILYFYDLAVEKGNKFSVKNISQITGKSETWVRKCLQNNNRIPKKGEA